MLIFRGMLFHFYRHWNTAHQTYHSVSVFSHPLYNFSLATCFLAWRVWQRLGREKRRRERGKKARKTQSAMLLHIVRVDFPTQQGHWGGGLRFLYSWVSTFTVCHTTFLSTPPLLSWGPFKDIILYKNTQLLSDGNAPWLWLSGSSGNNRRDVSQALGRAKADSALWLVDRGVTWCDIHGEPWWGWAGGANSQLALPFTFEHLRWGNYLAYITRVCYSPLGTPATTKASLSLTGLCSQVKPSHLTN